MNFQELVSKMKEYIKVHDYSNALRIAYILRKNFPSHDAGYSGAAQVYLANNDYIKSEEVCNEGINNAGLYSGPYIIKSEIYMKQRDFLAALKFWTVVREKFPLIEAGWTRSVHAYMELNQLKEAEKLCLQAMDISQKFSGIFIAYADISMLKNDFTTALKRWQTVRLKFPKERLGYIRAAYICIYLKNYQAAENILKEGVQINNINIVKLYCKLPLIQKKDYKECLLRLFSSSIIAPTNTLVNIACNLMTQNEKLNYLYNNIVFSIFSSCKKNNFSKNSNKLALFLSHPSAIYFYKNIINFIPANNLDIFILSKCDVNISLSNRIINYSDEYICQDYSLILCERNILQKIYKRNNTQRFCIISHSIDECYKIEDLKIAHLAILSSLKQNNNDDLFRTKNLNDYNLKLLSHIENKCEIVATGPFHLDGVHEFKKPKTELLNDLCAILNINIPTDKPIICILEDEFSQIGSLITGMNKLSSFCTVIFKPWYSLSSPLLKRLKRNIIIYNKKDLAPNLLKQCSDFIFAGYQSGTFISSIAAGLNVLGFYTRYTTQHCGVIKIPRHFKKSIPFILDPTDARHKEIILHKFYSDNKLFDILDHDSIKNAILGTEYLEWYHKVLPSLQKEAFDDYIVKGSAKKTAEYIMRFARDGTLGKDCSAIYLKK